MNEERLNAFEKMLSDILVQYDSVTEKLAALKYGLLDNDKK